MKKNSVTHGAFRKTSSKETKTKYPNKINMLLKTNITRRTLSATGKIRLVPNLPFQKRLFDRAVSVPPLPDKRVFQTDAVSLRNFDLPLPQRLYVFAVERQPFPELRFVPDNDVNVAASLFRVDGDKILRALFPIRKHKRVHKSFGLTDG